MIIFLLLLLTDQSNADFYYIDVGIAAHSNYYDTSDHPENRSTMRAENPLGIVETGYTYNSATVFISHISSIPDKHDNGLNMIGIKYRLLGD